MHPEKANAEFESALARMDAAESADSAESSQRRGFQRAESGAESAESGFDALATPPTVTKTMFYGLLGELAHEAADGTEVNPVSAMAAGMVWLSAQMGRNTCIHVGDEWHHLRLYGLHVGRSSRGGKGMSLGLLKRVNKALKERHAGLSCGLHTGGLSSREGLALLIHDGYREGKEDIPAIIDKRLFVVESEFANVLGQAKRDGNTLSTALRGAWDGDSIRPATKSSRIWATRPHIALYGCITPSELRAKMASNELSNGFANRFLTFWAERIGEVPYPKRTPDDRVDTLADRFAKVIEFGLAGYPNTDEPRRLTLSAAARARYAEAYREYRRPHPAGELITGLLERRAPMLLRMAGLFAVTDLTATIERQHIEAAVAWMDYYTQSVALIFGPLADAEGEATRNDDAERLYRYLRDCGGWVSRTIIANDCFKKRIHKRRIDAAIEALALAGRVERREVDTGGVTKRTEYRAKSPQIPHAVRSLGSPAVIKIPQSPQSPHANTGKVAAVEAFEI